MDLYEYQARQMFKEHGVPVLDYRLASTPEDCLLYTSIRRLARGTEVALSVPRSDNLEETAPNGRTQ